ncbi:MAG: ABC transporter permease [Cyclobacteriaceae bacterium]|nr:ABC transporter permease [Cyclobacteriaceae bacterium]
MNLIILAWSYLKSRPLTTVLNVVLLALGTGVITLLILFGNQLEEKITANAKGVDLVVGAKGSPMQLILCSVFHIDFPTGNINLKEAERIARHPLVKKAIPMALGDSYRGFRIVGTRRDYAELYAAELAEGKWWEQHLEVAIGATVARQLGLKLGDEFVSAHGLAEDGHDHEAHHYKVVGIVKPGGTVLDNLILTNVQSIWLAHDLEVGPAGNAAPSNLVPGHLAGDSSREVTSLLVQYRNPLAVIQLPRFINQQSSMQAAAPAYETARLFSILGVGADVLRGFALVLILVSGLSIFLVLYNSMKERRYDLAIMRSMGAGRGKLFTAVVLEGTFLTALGTVSGLALGHAVVWIFAATVPQAAASGIQGGVWYVAETWVLGGSLVLGVICSLVPALQAYKTDIHTVLAGN